MCFVDWRHTDYKTSPEIELSDSKRALRENCLSSCPVLIRPVIAIVNLSRFYLFFTSMPPFKLRPIQAQDLFHFRRRQLT
jgi:hypothetical protein